MEKLDGKVAVVTGGGSGIGEALVHAFAREDMHVVVADIEQSAAERVADAARETGARALAVCTDVADAESVRELADAVYAEFRATHVLCNNAGVLLMGPAIGASAGDWQWVLSVNLMGVVHGVEAFLPRMRAQPGEAHIVNTSSVAALGGGGPYAASKAAVLAFSEALHQELADDGIGVSVLCPAYINSKIVGAQRNRPERFGPEAEEPFGRLEVTTGLTPDTVAQHAIEAIRKRTLYVFTLPESMRRRIEPAAEERSRKIQAAIAAGVLPDPSGGSA
jgi:NAD(P)-dependent dehydrogenase (short-subunit alcohol dehydrogenase family)